MTKLPSINKNIIVMSLLILLLAIFIVNRSINKSISEEKLKAKKHRQSKSLANLEKNASQKEKMKSSQKEPHENKLVPDNPADYGIIITDNTQALQSDAQWKMYIENVIEQSGVLDSEQVKEEFKANPVDRQEYEKAIKSLNEQIAAQETVLKEDPLNEDATKRLDSLNQAKAMNEILKDKIIFTDKPTQAPENPSLTTPVIPSP